MADKKQELAITVEKSENISEWFTQVLQKADLMDYSSSSGSHIYKPNCYELWEEIQSFLDNRFKKRGVRNAYFPLLIPESLLKKEADHVEGFAPEVVWATQGGDTVFKERLAIRPTSETVMYDSYRKWINSYRDLPLKINQWCNVMRWERHTTPLMRPREFLWQEGHTVFQTKEEALIEQKEALEDYRAAYEELLAIPVTLGRKSDGEKFAGADYSITAEPFSTVDGKAIQACTSHHLGQNFSKAFDITFLDENQKKQYPFQNSWGFSVRSIATLILIHGDDKGLVLPPKVARIKVVIIPLLFKGKEKPVIDRCLELREELNKFGVELDLDAKQSPGFKYSKWELRGIPIRVEFGPRDLENNQVVLVRRDTNEKVVVSLDKVYVEIEKLLDKIQVSLFTTAKQKLDESTVLVETFTDFKQQLELKKRCLVPWAESIESEKEIKEETGAKSSCIPFEFESKSLSGKKCFYSGKQATCWAYFCKSY